MKVQMTAHEYSEYAADCAARGKKDDADKKAAAFADADRTNPFSGNQRLLLPWDNIEKKGMPHLRAHCLHFSNLPPQSG